VLASLNHMLRVIAGGMVCRSVDDPSLKVHLLVWVWLLQGLPQQLQPTAWAPSSACSQQQGSQPQGSQPQGSQSSSKRRVTASAGGRRLPRAWTRQRLRHHVVAQPRSKVQLQLAASRGRSVAQPEVGNPRPGSVQLQRWPPTAPSG
jgi:hypothetical protein